MSTGAARKIHLQIDTNVEPGRGDSGQQPLLAVGQGLEQAVQDSDEGELSVGVAHQANDTQTDGGVRHCNLL